MIKIVHLITSLSLGGAENQLIQLVTQSEQSHFQHIVISMQDNGVLGSKLLMKGIKLYSLGMKPGVPSIKACLTLYRILRQEHPDILQTWLYHADLLGLLVGKLAGISKIVWNLRCSNMNTRHYSLLTSLVMKLCIFLSRLPQAIIVNSKVGKMVHEQLGYQTKNWFTIPNGFKTERFKADIQVKEKMRATLNLNPETAIIGMIARFDPMKDHDSFLLAIDILRQRIDNFKALLVGTNIDVNNTQLMNRISALKLEEYVILLGPREDIPDIMNVLDVLVLPSAFGEGFSNVVGEAMASEVPCVATNTGDSADIIGDTGKIVPVRSPVALAQAIEELLALDKEQKQLLGKRARQKIIDSYTVEHIIKQYETVYGSFVPQSI